MTLGGELINYEAVARTGTQYTGVVHSLQCTLYSAQCTIYVKPFTVYSKQCTV